MSADPPVAESGEPVRASTQDKYRQAAFVYLHVFILHMAAIQVMWTADRGLIPTRFGPPLLWVLIAVAMTALVLWGLLKWRNPWFVRAVWLLRALRLPAYIRGAFFSGAAARVEPTLYLLAIVVEVINMWFLARAGWDL